MKGLLIKGFESVQLEQFGKNLQYGIYHRIDSAFKGLVKQMIHRHQWSLVFHSQPVETRQELYLSKYASLSLVFSLGTCLHQFGYKFTQNWYHDFRETIYIVCQYMKTIRKFSIQNSTLIIFYPLNFKVESKVFKDQGIQGRSR